MKLEFRVIAGHPSSDHILFWSDGGRFETRFFGLRDADLVLSRISVDGWFRFSDLEPDGSQWRMLIARPLASWASPRFVRR